MFKKSKIMIILMSALLLLAIVPLSASADSSYNATLPGGQAVKLAEEPIWLGTTVKGTQSKIYSTGNNGVQYFIKDSSGNIVAAQSVQLQEGEKYFTIELSTNVLGESLSLWAKNLYTSATNTVNLVGSWLD